MAQSAVLSVSGGTLTGTPTSATHSRVPESARRAVFAVEDTSAQLTWGDGPDGPGARDITGLAADADHVVDGIHFRTLAPPPGEELFRFATVSDMHVGDRDFGLVSHFVKPLQQLGPPTFALDCAGAALREAVDWGAQLIVVKGDMTRRGEPVEFAEFGRRLAAQPVPVQTILGTPAVLA